MAVGVVTFSGSSMIFLWPYICSREYLTWWTQGLNECDVSITLSTLAICRILHRGMARFFTAIYLCVRIAIDRLERWPLPL
jgi:hypothetical protein